VRERLPDLLTLQAERRPDAVAVVFRGAATNYGTLERTANRLARGLTATGCQRGDRVALLLSKSPKALTAMFGTLKADGIYVPIDTASPTARIQRILNQCECRCLLAESTTAPLLSELIRNGGLTPIPRILWMDNGGGVDCEVESTPWEFIEGLSDSRVESFGGSFAPAHVLFTSGSTGMPKGVVITHANVIHFIKWAVAYFGITRQDRISGHPPLHFDLSTFDIYGTIAAGAQIHLLPPEASLLPHRLAEFIREHELTQWFSVPSALLPMAKYDVLGQNDFPALRRLLWCGEKFPTPALTYFMKRLPRVAFFNLYGPTEATIASSYYRVPRCPEHDHVEIPIGKACPGESLLVLDRQLKPTPPCEVGDLYIAGVGLSPGYWNDPVKTAEAFRPNPWSSNESDHIYKTGDLARVGRDGMIYLLGRSDSQIKCRGHRIELGEIETVLHAVPGIMDAALVALDSQDSGATEICCAYVTSPNSGLGPFAVKKSVTGVLPHYMIPTRWMVLDSMPRNGNGKADRALLKERFCQEAFSQAAGEGV
jgi:amino acid adenylation domain-containing protein